MPVIPVPVSGSPYDLTTSSYVSNILAAGTGAPNAQQTAVIPTIITAASKAIIRWCNRPFVLNPYTEIVTPEGTRQSQGEPSTVNLKYFPVVGITRVATSRAAILTIANTDKTTNQDASVAFSVVGDPEYYSLVYNGINLTRMASGTQNSTSISWTTSSPYTTVNSVAATINGLGGGWSATVNSAGGITPNPGLLPAAYLVGAREPKGALSPGTALDMFTQSYNGYDIDRDSGVLNVWWSSTWGNGWGYGTGSGFGSGADGMGGLGSSFACPQIQVSYTAGFATIPEPLQQVCAELVKATLNRLKIANIYETQHSQEGQYSYTLNPEIKWLPDWAVQILTNYKDWRVG